MLYDYLQNISFEESETTAFSDVSSFTLEFSYCDSKYCADLCYCDKCGHFLSYAYNLPS